MLFVHEAAGFIKVRPVINNGCYSEILQKRGEFGRRRKKFIALQKSRIRAELWVWDWTWPQNALAKVTPNCSGREVSEVFIPLQVAAFIQSLGGSRLFHSTEVGHAAKRTHLHKHSHFQTLIQLWNSLKVKFKHFWLFHLQTLKISTERVWVWNFLLHFTLSRLPCNLSSLAFFSSFLFFSPTFSL